MHAVCFSVVFRATATLNREREKLFINPCAPLSIYFSFGLLFFELRRREINYWPAIRIYRRGKEMSAIIGCFCSCPTKQVAHTVRITNSPHSENMRSGVKWIQRASETHRFTLQAQRIWSALSQPALELWITRAYFPVNYALSSAVCYLHKTSINVLLTKGRRSSNISTANASNRLRCLKFWILMNCHYLLKHLGIILHFPRYLGWKICVTMYSSSRCIQVLWGETTFSHRIVRR